MIELMLLPPLGDESMYIRLKLSLLNLDFEYEQKRIFLLLLLLLLLLFFILLMLPCTIQVGVYFRDGRRLLIIKK